MSAPRSTRKARREELTALSETCYLVLESWQKEHAQGLPLHVRKSLQHAKEALSDLRRSASSPSSRVATAIHGSNPSPRPYSRS